MRLPGNIGRERAGRLVAEVSRRHADGYRSAVNQFDDAEKVAQAEACACAASNTGWFILNAMGFTDEDIRYLASQSEEGRQ